MKARHDAWTDFELQVLYDLVNEPVWLATAKGLIPHRSENALSQRMSRLRREAGIIVGGPGPRAMHESRLARDAGQRSSQLLVSAIEASLARRPEAGFKLNKPERTAAR